MKKYFIEIIYSPIGGDVEVISKKEADSEQKAVALYMEAIAEARGRADANGARLLCGTLYNWADVVESWAQW